jgi:GT2 family glycosyltransferase
MCLNSNSDVEIQQLKAELKTTQAQLAESHARIHLLTYKLQNENQRWVENIYQVMKPTLLQLAFGLQDEIIDLSSYGFTVPLQLFSALSGEVYDVVSSFENLEFPIPVTRGKFLQWSFTWDGALAGEALLLKVGTYCRVNHCHLNLSIMPDDEEDNELIEAQVYGQFLKDNTYAVFPLSKPLKPGSYRCRLTSPDSDNSENLLAVWLSINEKKVSTGLTLPDSTAYQKWYEQNRCNQDQLETQQSESKLWQNPPLISVVIPRLNNQSLWLNDFFISLHEQSYINWECIIIEDQANLDIAKQWCEQDTRFHLVQDFAAEGEYICVVDPYVRLEPQALFEIAKIIIKQQPAVIYSDEMLVDENQEIISCDFRQDFNYHFLLSHLYISHLTVFSSEIIAKVGGLTDLQLRVAAITQDFYHISKVLYRWRNHSLSNSTEQQLAAINQHLQMIGLNETEAWAEQGLATNFFKVHRKIKPTKVSIIIPTKDRVDLLRTCIDSFKQITRIPEGIELEFVIIDNGSTCQNTLNYLNQLEQQGVLVVKIPGAFNYSLLNNQAVAKASGSMLLFMNNDIEIVESGWLEAMLELMAWNDVGVVGSKLIYPNINMIQHAGVITGFHDIAGHDHQYYPEYDEFKNLNAGHNNALLVIRECMAVTAACMLVRRSVFEKVNGFDEQLVVGFGDTDLCLKIREQGYRCLFTPYARLIHHESASRMRQQGDPHPVDSALFRQKWEDLLKKENPFYNSNLSKTGKMFELKL